MALEHSAADAVVLDYLKRVAKRITHLADSATVRKYTGTTDQYVVCVECSDATAHLLKWNATSVASDDGLNAIKPTAVSGAGRWVLADADQQTSGGGAASDVTVDTSAFGKELSAADDTVQKALDTLDDHNHDDEYYTQGEIDSMFVTKSFIVSYETPEMNDVGVIDNYGP